MKTHELNQESKQGLEKTVKITEHIEVEINDPEILEYIRKVGINNVYLVGGTVRVWQRQNNENVEGRQ